ncbi:MAG: hypothetical protein RIK87_22580 [Fuerstiella sp.]
MLLTAGVALTAGSRCFAQLPAAQLDGIFPLGSTTGTTIELVISGEDLDDVDRLLFSDPGITAERKMAAPTPFADGPQPVENTFMVSIGNSVPVGRHQVRCRGKYGLSNARTFVVGAGPETMELEPNNNGVTATPVAVPCVIHGQAAGNADVDWYLLTGSAGQRLVVAGQAQQLDSLLNLVLAVCDESGQVISESRGGPGVDPVLTVTMPASGQCLLKVHDAQYRQGSGYGYRIDIRPRPHIDFVFPPAVAVGKTESVTVYGRDLPAGQPSDLKLDGQPLQQQIVQLTAPADSEGQLRYSGRIESHVATMDGFEYRLGTGDQASNPWLMTITDAPVIHESTNNDRPEQAMQLTLPCEVAGQFYPERDVDWFTFDAKQGETLAIELYSHRLGISTDPALLLQQVTKQDDGSEKARDIVFLDDLPVPNFRNESGGHEFDSRSFDPSWILTAPADGTYRLLIRDAYSSLHSHPGLVYRLVVRPPEPDFRLIAVPGDSSAGLVLRREGRALIRVFAVRRDGFDGEIRLKVDGLPEGVTSEEVIIGPSNRMGTLVLTASDKAQPTTASLTIVGSADINGRSAARTARFGSVSAPYRMSQPNSRLPSVPARITSDLQLCVTDEEPAPVLLTIGNDEPVEASRGQSVKIRYRVARRDGIGGNLIGFPMDFPINSTGNQVNIGSNKEGEFELRFNSNAPAGNYSVYLAGYLQNMPYRHNPEAVEQAKHRQQFVQNIQTEAATASKEADKALQNRVNDLTKANSVQNSARTDKQKADMNLKDATTLMAEAKKKRDALKQQSEKSADDQEVAKQLATAESDLASAARNTQKAETQADEAAERLQEADKQQALATEARAAAEQAAAAARAFVQEAQREKQRVDQLVRQKEQTARQRNINVLIPSNSLTVRLAEYPIELQPLPDNLTVTQGEQLEIKLVLKRLYDFTGNVSVQVQLPSGISGLSIPNINLGSDQTEGRLKVTAQSGATVGTHTLNLRFVMNLSGQLVMEHPLPLTVVEKAAAP